jgi:Flp pilus assembly pilin Flp
MTHCVKRLWTEQEGQNLPEFALLLFLICLTAVSAMGGVAIKVNSMYSNVSTHMAAASNPALTGGSTSYAAAAPAEIQTESKDATKQNPTD